MTMKMMTKGEVSGDTENNGTENEEDEESKEVDEEKDA